jgi:hypothetical protein
MFGYFGNHPVDFRVIFGYKNNMDTEVDESVKVWAFFDNDIFPVAMNWNRRFVKFEKVILKTSRKIGSITLVDLVCASETANYQLEYNSSNYSWKVKKVMDLPA